MSTITESLLSVPTSRQLRPFDARRDLLSVADLVELCFSETLDSEGRGYLRQMRSAAANRPYLRWASSLSEGSGLPGGGFVWDEDGRIVGNLTLIPFASGKQRYYLIANVAVHPEYRRRGIARQLTTAALQYAQQRGVQSAWLHARAENGGALQLYRSLNFAERASRTTWQSNLPEGRDQSAWKIGAPASPEEGANFQIGPRTSEDWLQQRAWLAELYPPEVTWQLPLSVQLLQPGLMGFLRRLFNDALIRQWSLRWQGQMLAVLSWQSYYGYADNLWLAAAADIPESALIELLRFARSRLAPRRVLSLDFPFGRFRRAFELSGFSEHQTLIWMEHKLLTR
jgi:ribosomal protein S18 acetylase RimI-like enzyme